MARIATAQWVFWEGPTKFPATQWKLQKILRDMDYIGKQVTHVVITQKIKPLIKNLQSDKSAVYYYY